MLIDTGEISINCELHGKGASIVLIHGFSDNLGMWYEQVPVLSKHYQVLAYDFRGHGRTKIPQGEMTMDMHADDLAALMSALSIEEACVIGYSMGGRIALEFALRNPAKITGLIMANMGVPGMGMAIPEKEAELMTKHVQMVTRLCETGDIEAIAEELVAKSLSQAFQKQHPAVSEHYKDIKRQNDPKYYPDVMKAMVKALETPPNLRQVTCPVLLIAGEYDPYINLEVVAAMTKAMVKAKLTILPAGHATAIEVPEAFNQAVLDFMETKDLRKN